MPGKRDGHTAGKATHRKARTSTLAPVAIPAAVLVGLWGYAATGLISDQITVRDDTKLIDSIDVPAYDVFASLEKERRLTATWQGEGADKSAPSHAELKKARDDTDAALKAYKVKSKGALSTKELKERAKKADESGDLLEARRVAIDAGKLDPTTSFSYYSDYISRFAALIGVASHAEDGKLAQSGTAATGLLNLVETISREDALLSGVITSGQLNPQTGAEFVQYVAIQDHVREALLDVQGLPADEPQVYLRLQADPQTQTLASIEGDVQAAAIAGKTKLPASVSGWRVAADTVLGGLSDIDGNSFKDLARQGDDRADTLLMQFALGSLAVIAALIGTYVVVRRMAGRASHRMTDLQQQIKELAEERLPEILAQLDRGEDLVIDSEVIAVSPHADELEHLGVSVQRLGRTFESALVRQARGREGTEKVFANLTRRTQILVHRLISLLDDLERKHEDSDLLQDIFKIDHLATRVRRHSENLVILGGASPGRRGTHPLSVTDVIRGAVSETEQYRRVSVHATPQVGQVMVHARLVTDLTHLMAELIENGTTFSPPDTQVQITVRTVARGLALHVEDRGLGMPTEQYEHLNALLAKPPQPDMDALGKDPRLGLFVVAKLGERHGLKVSLRESDYGGTLAVVLLPTAVLDEANGHEGPALQQGGGGDYRDRETTALPTRGHQERGLERGQDRYDDRGGPDRYDDRGGPDRYEAPGGPRPHTDGPGYLPGGPGVPPVRSAPPNDFPGYVPEHVGAGAAPQYEEQHGFPEYGGGFPDYGGAGLLPQPSDGQEAYGGQASSWAQQDRYGGGGYPPERANGSGGYAPERSNGSGGYTPEPSYSDASYQSGQSYGGQGYAEPYGRGQRGPGYGEPQYGHVASQGGPVEQQDRSGPLDEPQALPTRKRGASLAKQLRDEAPARSRGNEEDMNRFTPGRSAANIMAIQRETRRAREGQAPPASPLDSPAESRHNGTDEL